MKIILVFISQCSTILLIYISYFPNPWASKWAYGTILL
jgi:hypothetical protein